MDGRSEIIIDLAAVADNVRRFAAMGEVVAVVKANAFGHGDVRVAHTAMRNGASGLGVTTYHEALGLRRAGITAPILTWPISPGDDHEAALAAELDIAVGTLDVLDAIARACVTTRRTGRIHLHVDCGMNREGARSSELLPLIHRARALERAGLIRVIGLMGHLPDAGLGPEHNDGGLELFADSYHQAFVAGLRPEIVHLAATAAALTDWRARSCPHRSAIARDVHDVVGHSLTVILAQAEAGQFVTTEAELRATLERISGVARSSLRDVRTVLADLKQDTSDLRAPLRALAGSGFKVVETSSGTPRPLPPELSTTIRRILQEIVTNVVKHADPSEPVHVAWIWSDNLQVHVSNRAAATPAPDGSGMGIESMTAMALAVGGTARVWREGDIVTSHFSIPITRHQEIR